MTRHSLYSTLVLSLVSFCSIAQNPDNVIYAEGKIVNALTKEPVNARITYQSLPYGSRIGVINNSTYSFPMFDNEKYAIVVEATGFSTVKYLLDPSSADSANKVIKDVELSSEGESKHAIGQVMRLDNLIFEVGKSKIDPESYSELDVLVDMMVENPKMVIQLEGHTDYLGEAKVNYKLSQSRVESVRDYIANKGITRSRIKTKAFGGTQPLSRENTPEAHRLNRRVEVRILQN
ncbi:OmpA family protein [Chryseosolibacter indicus]|uniref:OmpA family protein n=1 Tax=Chryseosolibacter indicus TaxID=2782351 RepID=A0ABS5VPH4_9BACT|nr:OmpA family protein [Chryseosolibacter indicus]MBT1703046.1 OmpA family protein [Chryseosolibacter indicus]